ncbi:unnamed protein product, partial [Ectocarpus sp. 12 AP-2014]
LTCAQICFDEQADTAPRVKVVLHLFCRHDVADVFRVAHESFDSGIPLWKIGTGGKGIMDGGNVRGNGKKRRREGWHGRGRRRRRRRKTHPR